MKKTRDDEPTIRVRRVRRGKVAEARAEHRDRASILKFLAELDAESGSSRPLEFERKLSPAARLIQRARSLRYALAETDASHARAWKRVQELEGALRAIRETLRPVPECGVCRDRPVKVCTSCGRREPGDDGVPF